MLIFAPARWLIDQRGSDGVEYITRVCIWIRLFSVSGSLLCFEHDANIVEGGERNGSIASTVQLYVVLSQSSLSTSKISCRVSSSNRAMVLKVLEPPIVEVLMFAR